MTHTVIINQLTIKQNKRFDAQEIPFRVICEPNLNLISNLGDYIDLVEDILTQILSAVRSVSNSDQDMISIMIRPSSFTVPIVTAWVRLADYNNDLVYGEIEKVYQSNKKFIFEEEFYVWGRLVRQPRGGSRINRIQNVTEARLKMKSIKRIEVENGWCMPAAVWMAKQHADSSPNYRNYRETTRPGFLKIIKQYTGTVLGIDRDLGTQNGAPFADLQTFQENLGNCYQIKVFAFANPKREFVWASTFNNNLPMVRKDQLKRVNLMYDNNHFDVITKLGGFFNASGFCHECNKCYHDVRTHRCIEKCGSCWRVNCPVQQPGEIEIICSDCSRSFRHENCYDYHKSLNQQSQKSLCQRAYYCKSCCRLIFQKGKKVVKHMCGEIHCKNCKSFVDASHKCYIKSLTSRDDKADESNERDEDEGDIAEERAKEKERNDGIVFPPSDTEKQNFKNAMYAYYDCEARVSGDCEHICNLVVVQWGEYERLFRGENAKVEFCKWALTKDHKNWTFVAHNAKRYDDYFIMNYLVTHTPCLPTIITSGGSTLLIKLQALNIRFIDSCCFIPSPLAKLPEIFGIENTVKKGFFPHEFNRPENYEYAGPMPDKKFYQPEGMSVKRREEFEEWYAERLADNYVFKFWEELIAYCQDDVRVLRECCILFREQYFSITNIDPFTKVTLASACNDTYRRNFLPPNSISIIPPNGYYGHDKQSREALIWLEWMIHKTGFNINHAYNGGEREVQVRDGRKFKLDGMADVPNELIGFEFYGCFIHGCKECYTGSTFNTLRQSTMENLYRTTLDREKSLKKVGFKIYTVWECQFKRQAAQDPEMSAFLETYELEPPLEPRKAFYGGRTEGIKLHHTVTGHEKLSYVDINSLYPWVQKTQRFPVGHPIILRNDEIDINGLTNYFGLIKCRILPPRSLYHPVLPTHVGKKLKFILCLKCADDGNTKTICQHSERERALSGTWVSTEIDVALKLGYRIIKVFEIWHFPETRSDLFTGYVKVFTKEKLQSKGYPTWACNDDTKKQYVNDIRRLEGIELDPEKIVHNPGRVVVAKLCLNTLWGKFGQRNNLPQTKFIRSQMELWEMFSNERFDVRDVVFPSDQLAQVSFAEKDSFVMAGINTNVVIAAFTTAYARLKLYQSILPLDQRVCYMDTDSIIFVDPNPNDPNYYRPQMGEQLGAYKDEIGDQDTMTEFVTAGPKNYGYRTQNMEACLKVKGITLNYTAQQVLDFTTIRDLVTQRNFDSRIHVPMGFTIRREKEGWKLYTRPNEKKYRFYFDKRIILESPDQRTIPFGYVQDDQTDDLFPSFPLNEDINSGDQDDTESIITDMGSYSNDSFIDDDLNSV